MDRPFLTDFGLAKSAATGSRLTRTGEALGTPAYMSPEQARGEVSALTAATDVWSLGGVLYEMLAGRPPFDGPTPAAVIAGLLTREPTPLRARGGDVPADVDRLVRVCLGKAARDRYPEAGALRDDLDRVLRGLRTRARPPGRGRLGWVAAFGLAGVTGAMLVAWPRTPPPSLLPPASPAAPGPSGGEELALRARAVRGTDPRTAASLLDQALVRSPGRLEWRLEKGVALWCVGEGAAARSEWERIPDDAREAAAARLYRGLEALFRLDSRDARSALEAAAARGGRDGDLARAALLVADKTWGPARDSLRGRSGWEAALLRAYVEDCDPAGDIASSVTEYTAALSEGPAFAWAYTNRGDLQRRRGDLDGAIRDHDVAITLEPGLKEAWNNRGLARRRMRDLAGALSDFEAAIALDGGFLEARLNRGKALTSRGDPAAAEAEFDRILGLDPRHTNALVNRGIVRRDQGRPAEAIGDFDAALAVSPEYPEAYANRALVRRALGDMAGALADTERCLAVAPTDWPGRDQAERLSAELRELLRAQGGGDGPSR